jgi:hypothetical protein
MRHVRTEKAIKKFTKEEILQTISFVKALGENDSIIGAEVRVYESVDKREITEMAIDAEISSFTDNEVSFFLTSDILEGTYIIHVLVDTDSGQRLMNEARLIVRNFFIA